ncbi:MAG: DUF1036 domain-containing protein, partial [Nitrospiraceae bacterium]
LLPMLEGLSQVHAASYLHRDIKPGNIIIRLDGSPVLIDFGAARQAVGVKSRSVTSIVTPGYAPIEQYSSRGKQGPWTDIYALGAVSYRVLTGLEPEDATERVREDPLVSAVEAGKGWASEGFLKAIDWALAVNEKDRPQTVGAWRARIQVAEVAGGAASTSVAPDTTSATVRTATGMAQSSARQVVAPAREPPPKRASTAGRSLLQLVILFSCTLGAWMLLEDSNARGPLTLVGALLGFILAADLERSARKRQSAVESVGDPGSSTAIISIEQSVSPAEKPVEKKQSTFGTSLAQLLILTAGSFGTASLTSDTNSQGILTLMTTLIAFLLAARMRPSPARTQTSDASDAAARASAGQSDVEKLILGTAALALAVSTAALISSEVNDAAPDRKRQSSAPAKSAAPRKTVAPASGTKKVAPAARKDESMADRTNWFEPAGFLKSLATDFSGQPADTAFRAGRRAFRLTDADGNTPLMIAAQAGNSAFVDKVIASRPDWVAPEYRNHARKTAADIAREFGHAGIAKRIQALVRTQTEALQRELQLAGKRPGPVDGVLGERTRRVAEEMRKSGMTHAELADDLMRRNSRGLYVCNHSRQETIWFAVGHERHDGSGQIKGWYEIPQNSCVSPYGSLSGFRNMFGHGDGANGGNWGERPNGSRRFCVITDKFEYSITSPQCQGPNPRTESFFQWRVNNEHTRMIQNLVE